MQFSTTIKSIQHKTPQVAALVLDYDGQDFNFHPGQWVDVHLTIDDETHNCCYSITSIPSEDHCIEIAVKLTSDFPITQYLHKHSKAGDKVYISKAQGNVYLDNNIAGPYVFIAGGIGITPLYSMIQHLLAKNTTTPVNLLYSIATAEDFLFEDELKALQKNHENFRLVTTITRSKNNGGEFSGRITKDMLRRMKLPPNANYYLCGPPPMVDAVAGIINNMREELKISIDNIHYDKWWS